MGDAEETQLFENKEREIRRCQQEYNANYRAYRHFRHTGGEPTKWRPLKVEVQGGDMEDVSELMDDNFMKYLRAMPKRHRRGTDDIFHAHVMQVIYDYGSSSSAMSTETYMSIDSATPSSAASDSAAQEVKPQIGDR